MGRAVETTVLLKSDLLGLAAVRYVKQCRTVALSQRPLSAAFRRSLSSQTASHRPTRARQCFSDTCPLACAIVSPGHGHKMVVALAACPRIVSLVTQRKLHGRAVPVSKFSAIRRPR